MVVLLEAIALYSTSWIVYIIFLLTYIIITIFIAFDCYYIGIGRMDTALTWSLIKDIFVNCKSVSRSQNDGR